jgi:hypothetical protein
MVNDTKNNYLNKTLENTIAEVWHKLVLSVADQIKNNDLSKTPCDIVSESISYALKNKKIDWNNKTNAKKHLYYSAKKVCSWIIKNESKKVKRSRVKYTLDTYAKNEEGESVTGSWLISKYSHDEYWKNHAIDNFFITGHLALKKLDSFLAEKGVSERDIGIYKSWELYSVPTAIVTEKYKISTSNLHKIVCTVNKIISRYGRELLNAA